MQYWICFFCSNSRIWKENERHAGLWDSEERAINKYDEQILSATDSESLFL